MSRRRTVAGRKALAAFLQGEGLPTPPSETNFVFVLMASGAPELAHALEERGVPRSAGGDPAHLSEPLAPGVRLPPRLSGGARPRAEGGRPAGTP